MQRAEGKVEAQDDDEFCLSSALGYGTVGSGGIIADSAARRCCLAPRCLRISVTQKDVLAFLLDE